MEEMKRAFRPEFLNRIDDIIVFHSLSEQHIKSIIRLMITRINKQLTEKGIELMLTPAAENALVEKGYDPTYGARQLRRTIQKHIEDPLAEAIVRGQLVESARIEVDVEGGNFVFREAQPRLPTRLSSLPSTEPVSPRRPDGPVTRQRECVRRPSSVVALLPALAVAHHRRGPARPRCPRRARRSSSGSSPSRGTAASRRR